MLRVLLLLLEPIDCTLIDLLYACAKVLLLVRVPCSIALLVLLNFICLCVGPTRGCAVRLLLYLPPMLFTQDDAEEDRPVDRQLLHFGTWNTWN